MDPSYVQNLHQLLEATLNPDTNVLRAATTQLNTQYYKSPQCIPALFEIAVTSSNQAIRQLAGVELRKRIASGEGKLWKKTDQSTRTQIKEALLQRLTQEPSAPARHALARIVSAIADIELTTQPVQWPSLLPGLYAAARSQDASHREIAVYVLFAILDTVADSFETELKNLFQLFATTLLDPESNAVRMTTLRGLAKVAEYISTDDKHDIKAFQELVMPMLKVTQQAINDEDDEGVKHAYDVFETLMILDTPLVSKHVGELTQFFLTNAANKDVDETMRGGALNVLAWIVRYKKSKVQALGLAKPIIEGLLPIGCEDDPEDVDEDSPSRLAFRCLDALSQALPPQQVFPVLTAQLQVYMSGDARMRKSALMAFGVSVEGCSEFIRPHVDQLWPAIEGGLQDAEVIVRRAACIALGCLCEWLPEECATRHATIVPILFNLIVDESTQKNACTCLDSYLEILGEDIVNYLTLLMERLLVLLEGGAIPVKITVTGAIGSAAHAAKERFTPYFDQTIKRLVPFLTLQGSDEQSDLRGVATDTIGTIADAVGADIFRPYFHDLMKSAFEALTMDNTRLRESSFIFFGVMAQVFEGEFAGYLPQCVPALVASCQQSESTDELLEDGESSGAAIAEAFASGSSRILDEDITGEDDGETDINALDAMFAKVNSAVAIEKEVATDTIGELFTATKEAFMPYIEETVQILIDLLDHYYEGIRKSAVGSLFAFIKTIYDLSDPQEWIPGAVVRVPLHVDVKKLVDHILPKIFELWQTEDDKSVVILVCSELAETMNKCGPALVEGYLDLIATNAIEILEKKSLCQQDPDGDDENVEDADSSEYESALISNASDVFGAMASILGPDFAQAFGKVLPLISRYSEPKRISSERSMAVGCLGEIIVGLKDGVTQFTQPLLEIISRGLRDEEPDVRSNAAFASGVLIQESSQDLSSQFVPLLTALQPYFSAPEHSAPAVYNARDNAAGAISRMIVKNPNALPLDQVLPVIVSVMPLQFDPLENKAVYAAIFSLFRTRSELLMPHIDHLLKAFAYNLDTAHDDDTTDETKNELRALVEHLRTQVPDKVAQAGL
ncbi:armadillo-type protein [Kockovaella imperatae]|uniref:Armadillo-type protein n=1 Tax=Kockovaella imperatae TaxID=4999 RepID=A0A1Y1UMJ6_9TREE|nr:armadillo-type protein [Kockovaella imperatae]ORX39229.1 armadillo-type protein [Kockovaella imperatae]